MSPASNVNVSGPARRGRLAGSGAEDPYQQKGALMMA
jgi:hypothetical protein